MTRITPWRLTTLQCSQIGLTLERTFTSFLQTSFEGELANIDSAKPARKP
jgi:hypothetical protein